MDIWGLGETSCYCLFYLGVVLHRVQHPHGPARGALCCAGAFVVLLVLGQFGSVGLAGNSYPGPRRSSQCAGPASRARAARRQAALAGSAYRRCVEFLLKKLLRSGDTLIHKLLPACWLGWGIAGGPDQLLLPVLLGCCTAPGAASPWPGARSAVLRRGLCGAAGAGAVRQCRPGGQQLPRPQTFQPMRWACQPSQSSTPASSPCGISVSPLRRFLLKKLLRSDDA